MSHDDRDGDQYDDYDDIDDEYPDPGVPGGFVGDAETLLRRAIDIVASAVVNQCIRLFLLALATIALGRGLSWHFLLVPLAVAVEAANKNVG